MKRMSGSTKRQYDRTLGRGGRSPGGRVLGGRAVPPLARAGVGPSGGGQTGDEPGAGLLTQGGQGPPWPADPAPFACRFHRILTHFPLNLHGIDWKSPIPIVGPLADWKLSPQARRRWRSSSSTATSSSVGWSPRRPSRPSSTASGPSSCRRASTVATRRAGSIPRQTRAGIAMGRKVIKCPPPSARAQPQL